MIPAPAALGGLLFERRHTALLLTIVALFASRPFVGDTGVGAVVSSLGLLGVMLAALTTIHFDDTGEDREVRARQRRRMLVGGVLAVPAVVERLMVFLAPNRTLIAAGAFWWLVLFSYITWCQASSLLRRREVTGEAISTSMSIYLLLGLCWTLLDIVIFTRHPDAFHMDTPPDAGGPNAFPVFLYFSLTTLSTIGYGDITPVSLPARYAAVAEGIAGQFYLAILVARLVGLQMSQAASGTARPRDEAPKP